ncbi:hypothetical protein M1771_00330 [Spiroplasma citri]|uniref:Transmembrane protein n=2 Tax=Spiroplasma citri TaxID=2133 RepID=A0AAX3SYX1_SPICI|nr:hypothetical protein [Spiroplasma citri]WFG96497.1 hypothetical protein M0C40_00320 [Spiroplasma citri]WFH00393.1 hypothetical protein M1771_00330 [Spiroplasma citri]
MYINPFERMKNLKLNTDETNTINMKSNNRNINLLQGNNEDGELTGDSLKNNNHNIKTNELKIDGITLSSFEIIRDLMKIFKEKNNEMQFFLAVMDKGNCDSMSEIATSFFSMPLVNIDLLRIELYASPFLFLLKKIIKGLPKVNLEDKKVLWDRVKLFARTLKQSESLEQVNDSNSIVIVNELEFDDPLEYIRREFEEILRAYDITENIVVIFNNIDLVEYVKFKQIFSLVQAIFKGILQFKFIAGLNPLLIETYVKQMYGNYATDQLVAHEVSVYNKRYIIKNEDDNVVTKEPTKEAVDSYHPMSDFASVSTETEDEDDETIGFDYWAMRGGK